MTLDALFRMPMTRRPEDGGLRPFACGPGAGSQPARSASSQARRVRAPIGRTAGR